MSEIKFFCASNDPEMLVQNIIKNQYVNQHSIEIEFDHNRGKGLPERYNEFIDRNLDSDAWLVFIHDDVELLEPLNLDNLPKDIIYGLCGAKKINGKGEIVGQILARDPRINNGQDVTLGTNAGRYEIVPTFDPLCIIINSELANEKFSFDLGWRVAIAIFDENLGYHLHSEEMSINAKKNYGVQSAVVQTKCRHYSWGTKTPEYYAALEYIKRKHGLKRFIGTCEHTCMDDSNKEDWE
jgi:hypothetical protein